MWPIVCPAQRATTDQDCGTATPSGQEWRFPLPFRCTIGSHDDLPVERPVLSVPIQMPGFHMPTRLLHFHMLPTSRTVVVRSSTSWTLTGIGGSHFRVTVLASG